MNNIEIGKSVKIRRTDGRIHVAIVTNINEFRKVLLVEWYEYGDIKGKEIALDEILKLNSDLLDLKKQDVLNSTNYTILKPRATNTNTADCLSSSTGVGDSNSPGGKPNTFVDFQANRDGVNSLDDTQIINYKQSISQCNTGSSTYRGSSVVKEVERIKKNREERRTRQAEIKEEKTALMKQNSGNPNWEIAQMIREYQGTLESTPLTDGQPIEHHQITVCVRKRPLSRKELNRKDIDVITVPRKDTLIVHETRCKVDLTKFLENHKFRFDYVFDDHCDNILVYKYTAKPLIQTTFEGGVATCFAYGQTGSGKTHTMGGVFNGKIQDCKNGIYALAAKDVFQQLNDPRYCHLNLVVSASFFEIYSSKLFDLLSGKKTLRILEDGKQQVRIMGLTEKVVENVEQMLKLIQCGNTTRTSSRTSANANSSRSHAVFQILLRSRGSSKIHGKFSFIDLAGNERGADTSSANRQTRMEGAEINKALLALKECIRALGKQSAHLPFRDSKLTQVLRDSFIGENSRTCMIAMISPSLSSCEHTLNTLRYADRVKELMVQEISDAVLGMSESVNVVCEIENKVDNNSKYVSPKSAKCEKPQQHHDSINHEQAIENDSVMWHSLSEHNISSDVLVENSTISDLQPTKEMVIEQHRAINVFLAKTLHKSMSLINSLNDIDCDEIAYCTAIVEYLTELINMADKCRDLTSDYRTKLVKDEVPPCTEKPPGES